VACLNYQVRAQLDPVLVPGADCLTPYRIVECGKGAFGWRDVFHHGTLAYSPSAATHYTTGLKSLASKATDSTIGRLHFSGNTTPRRAGTLTR
jgi:hypothetical protein